MTIENKIAQIAESLGVAYQYANWAQTNVDLDALIENVSEACIIYTLPASGAFDISLKRGRAYDSPATLISFVAPAPLDFNGQENNDTVEQMKRLSLKFINAVNESDFFEPVEGTVTYRVIYDYLDANVTGVTLEMTLKEKEGVRLCDASYERGDE